MPNLYIIAGPNGAGKTTVAQVAVPNLFSCKEFVNADYIAAGLSPLAPEKSALQAGKLMLQKIASLLEKKQSFAFETTLASTIFVALLRKAKMQGYKTHLIFLYLPNPKIAQARVKERVSKGGHHIDAQTIKRRFVRGLDNFFSRYSALVDSWVFLDNTGEIPAIIAECESGKTRIYNEELWRKIQKNKK